MVRTSLRLVAVLGLALVAAPAEAGKYNKKLSIGDAAPVFTDLPTADGKKISLSDLKAKDVVVVVITCNHCPVAQDYEDRIIQLSKKYTAAPESRVAVVAINVNTGDDDKLDKMTERAKAKGYTFPYAYDATQKVGRDLGATTTPEFFVFGKDRKVAYMGTLDDSQPPSDVTKKYVEEAIDALLAGKPVATKETRPHGCSVQYNKK